MGGMGGMGGTGGTGGMVSSGGSGDGDGEAAIEIDPAQVRAIRRMVAENPSLTGPLIESLKQTDPERAAHLTPSDPDGILRFFEELGDDEAPQSGSNGALARLPAPPEPRRAASPPAAQNAGLTPAEQASIQRVSLKFTFTFPTQCRCDALLTSCFVISWRRWAIRAMLCFRRSFRVESTRNWQPITWLKVLSTKPD
jgi:hypothetical protein